MAVPQPQKRYTPKEYYALEQDAAYKSDFYDGEIFAMSGGTSVYSRITTNILGELHHRLRDRPCAPFDSNLRVKIRANGFRTYPDASIFCDEIEFDHEDPKNTTALNPTVVFEVLSPATERYDRGFKSESYRQIESLKAYVLVSQDAPHVEVYERQGGGEWTLRETSAIDAQVTIPGIDVELPLAQIYARVEFSARISPWRE